MVSYSSLSSIAIAASSLILCAALARILQRRCFHSLSGVPGPWLNGVTSIPAAIALARGVQNSYYYKLHMIYGPVVRVGPDEVSFASADAYEPIYGLRRGSAMNKSPNFLGVASPLEGHVGLGLADPQTHARQRRQLAPTVSKTALSTQESILRTHVDKTIAKLHEFAAAERTCTISDWWTYYTFDVIADICFGQSFGCLDLGSSTEWSLALVNVVISATWAQAIRNVVGVGNWAEKAVTWLLVPKKAMHWRSLHLIKTRELVLRRMQQQDLAHPDVIYHVMQQSPAIPTPEIILNMVLFLSAGSETTSVLLTAWTYLICTHHAVYERVRAEVRETFLHRTDITVEAVIKKLPYLRATVQETLRLFPPASVSLQRVVPPGGAEICGICIAPHVTVSVSPWSTSRSASYFQQPNAFHPERWLEGDARPAAFKNDRLDASRPFSVGPRTCLGMHLAEYETHLMLVHLLWNFDLAASEQASNELWSLNPCTTKIRVFQALKKPDYSIRLRRAGNLHV